MASVFVYGTLLQDRIASSLLCRLPPHRPATLHNFARLKVKKAAFPAIISRPGSSVDGRVFTGLTQDEVLTFDRYEGIVEDQKLQADEICEYSRLPVTVVTAEGDELPVFAYVWATEFRDSLSDEPWSYEAFMAHDFETFWREEMAPDTTSPVDALRSAGPPP